MTGRALLDPQAREHLCKLLGMLGSDHDGEIAAAGRKAYVHIKRLRLTWADVIVQPAPEWQTIAFHVRAHRHMLNAREVDFINNIARLRAPSQKQLDWLRAIYARLQREVV
jgi:hypothetical protein